MTLADLLALREESVRPDALLEALPLAVALFDRDLRLVRANARFVQLTGCPRDAEGSELHEVFSTALPSIAPVLAAALRGSPFPPRTLAFPFRGGTVLADVEVVPAPGVLPAECPGTDAILFAGSNVRAGASDALAASRPMVPASDDPALVLARFASALAHEVANVLNPIGAAAHLVSLQADDPEAVREHAARIRRAVELGTGLLDRIARLSRLESVSRADLGSLSFTALIARAASEAPAVWHGLGEAGRLQVAHTVADGVHVLGAADELSHAIAHLVRNALQSMSGMDAVLDIGLEIVGAHAVLAIRDEGRGIEPELCERIGEPFLRGSRRDGRRDGRGLGLAEVSAIARRHGGHLVVARRSGPGTVARLYLPRLPMPLGAPARTAADESHVRYCLVVENEPEARELMRALLVAAGHRVVTASGVAAAFALLEEGERTRSMPDVLLTDLSLEDGCGSELTAAVRARWPALRIGVVTGWDDAGPPAGADFLLLKPFRSEELLNLVAGHE